MNTKNILITGGSRGIGKCLALHFLQNEQIKNVIVLHKNDILDEEYKKIGIHFFKIDITLYEETKNIINNIIEKFGKIDILINNAGILKNSLFHKMKFEEWNQVIQTNLTSIYNVTHPIIQNMLENNYGRIINISSISGLKGSKGQTNYCSSKFGLIGFTKSLAKEMGARNIRCNTVAPGFIETDMTDELDDKTREAYLSNIPLKRFGKPAEIADVCVFLSSDMGAYISGQTISVCGALTT